MIAEEGSVFLHHLTSTRLYSKVPYFTSQMRSANPLSFGALKDWVRGNGILQIVGGGVFLGIIESFLPHAAAQEITETPFSVLGLLKNFAMFRIVVDIAFYSGHRLLHENKWLYNNIHKRHHEHFTTNLRTNFHFTAVDLFIESAFPIFAGISVLRGLLGIKFSRFVCVAKFVAQMKRTSACRLV
jgi:sterol desaturase/sphingolipid hydroxylase (fatty acid hydroxylase superfamily)